MTVEMRLFLQGVPAPDKCVLAEVGLGYIKRPAGDDFERGEAQRVQAGQGLSRRATGQTLYFSTTDHRAPFRGVCKLLEVLHALVEQAHTVVVIEQISVSIKTADWVLDLGPGGGVNGGGSSPRDAEKVVTVAGALPAPLKPLRGVPAWLPRFLRSRRRQRPTNRP